MLATEPSAQRSVTTTLSCNAAAGSGPVIPRALTSTAGEPIRYSARSMKWHPSPTSRPPPTSGSCTHEWAGWPRR